MLYKKFQRRAAQFAVYCSNTSTQFVTEIINEALPRGGSMSPIWILKCLVSRFHFARCHYFLSHVACRNLPWQDLINGGDNIFQIKNAEQKKCDVNYNYLDMSSNCSKFISEVKWEIWLQNLVVTYFQERIVIDREVQSLVSIHWGFSLLDGNGLNVALDGVHYSVVYVMIIINFMKCLLTGTWRIFERKTLRLNRLTVLKTQGKTLGRSRGKQIHLWWVLNNVFSMSYLVT